MDRTSKLTDVIYPISAYVLWGSLFVVTKYTSGQLSIATLAFFRSLIACVALYLILLYQHKSWVPIQKGRPEVFHCNRLFRLLLQYRVQYGGGEVCRGYPEQLCNHHQSLYH